MTHVPKPHKSQKSKRMSKVVLETMESRQRGMKVDAERAYRDLLKQIHENALENFNSLGSYAKEIENAKIFTDREIGMITEAMFMENVVWNCFSTSKAMSPLLASITLEILLREMLKKDLKNQMKGGTTSQQDEAAQEDR